jgi:hypothetical protein
VSSAARISQPDRSARHPSASSAAAVASRASPSATSHDAGSCRSSNHAITSRTVSASTAAELTTPFSVFDATPVRTA